MQVTPNGVYGCRFYAGTFPVANAAWSGMFRVELPDPIQQRLRPNRKWENPGENTIILPSRRISLKFPSSWQ
jgi:hypothetical protein